MDRELRERILALLAEQATFMTAKQIATLLGTSKHCVNACLYSMYSVGEILCEGERPPRWASPPLPAEEHEDDAPGAAAASDGNGQEAEPMEVECGLTLFSDLDVLARDVVTHLKDIDPVCAVNEYCMQTHRCMRLQEARSGGGDHCPLFTSAVFVDDVCICTATAHSKRAARKEACRRALAILIDNCGVAV